jgi:hypothetical protein
MEPSKSEKLSSVKALPLRFTDHGGGWGLVASPVFKTGVTRHGRAGWVRFPHSPAMALALMLALITPSLAIAQRTDSTRAGVTRKAPIDTAGSRLRIKPGRAFLGSLLIPGMEQVKLGRPKAATLFAIVEAGTIAMSAKSWNDLSKAKAARNDTVAIAVLGSNGQPVIDPVTGIPDSTYAPRNPNLVGRIKARRTHLEDWIAAIVFNHLFAGADAFVAANLQDFNTNVQANSTADGIRVVARVAW